MIHCLQTHFSKRSSIYESGCGYNSTIQIVCTMAWLIKKVQTVVSKLRNKKEKTRPEVSLRKELDETKARLEKSEEAIESLLKRVEQLEKSRVVPGLPIQILPLEEQCQGDEQESFILPSGTEISELPVDCHERNRWRFWKWKSPSKTLVYQNYSSSSGAFSDESTGVQGKFASVSYTSATINEIGAMENASQSPTMQDQIHSEIIRKAIEMAI